MNLYPNSGSMIVATSLILTALILFFTAELWGHLGIILVLLALMVTIWIGAIFLSYRGLRERAIARSRETSRAVEPRWVTAIGAMMLANIHLNQ